MRDCSLNFDWVGGGGLGTGINMRTELGYHYTTDLLREQWRIEDITYEDKGRIYSELTGATYPSGANTKSGALPTARVAFYFD